MEVKEVRFALKELQFTAHKARLAPKKAENDAGIAAKVDLNMAKLTIPKALAN